MVCDMIQTINFNPLFVNVVLCSYQKLRDGQILVSECVAYSKFIVVFQFVVIPYYIPFLLALTRYALLHFVQGGDKTEKLPKIDSLY